MKAKETFKCMICQDMGERGSMIRVRHGCFKNNSVKVCTKSSCVAKAACGEFELIDGAKAKIRL